MNSILLRSVLRQRQGIQATTAMLTASRGGGFHKPDPSPYPWYQDTRRVHLEDVNTVLYSDIAPEFHMHLHSIQI